MEPTLGKRIVTNRKRLGMTQDQLAERLGVTAQAVSKWENDQSCPDITMLPKLAEIFGTTTDALLGITQEPPVMESTAVQREAENEGIHIQHGDWEFKYDNSRMNGIFLAALAFLIGGLYLAVNLLHLDIGLWDVVWPAAMVVFGIRGLWPKFSVLSLGVVIFGCFFLTNQFLPNPIHLDNGVMIAVIILLIGGGLLTDALRKPKKPKFQFHYNGKHTGETPTQEYHVDGENFCFNGSFDDLYQSVKMDRLAKGEINTSFGDFTVDLTAVAAVAENCAISANTSFGELTILVPQRYQVRCFSSASFAEVETEGRHDDQPVGQIRLDANVSFGQITIQYI